MASLSIEQTKPNIILLAQTVTNPSGDEQTISLALEELAGALRANIQTNTLLSVQEAQALRDTVNYAV